MVDKNVCIRCNGKMQNIGVEKIQLGQTGFFFGDLSNLLSGAMEVTIYVCKNCSKVEFYSNETFEENLKQVTCPKCGHVHDFDYPKCPSCGHKKY